jgi:radical SAM-linked protein
MPQIVCRFSKEAAVRFVGHLDLMRCWERAIRRAEVPMAYTEGFNPRPRFSLAAALGLGVTSDAELLVLELAAPMSAEQVRDRLNAALPEGLRIKESWGVPVYRKKFSVGDIDTADYLVTIDPRVDSSDLETRIRDFLAQEQITVTRVRDTEHKPVDARKHVLGMELVGPGEFKLRVRCGPAGSIKPTEVMEGLGFRPDDLYRAHRTALYASGETGPTVRRELRRLVRRPRRR